MLWSHHGGCRERTFPSKLNLHPNFQGCEHVPGRGGAGQGRAGQGIQYVAESWHPCVLSPSLMP